MHSRAIQQITKIHWLNRWAGSYTFISCSIWGPRYFYSLQTHLGVPLAHTLFIHRKGTASFYEAEKEYQRLGKKLAGQSERTPKFAIRMCKSLKRSTDTLLPMMRKLQRSIPSPSAYKHFYTVFDRHLALHVFVKKTVDFLSPDGLRRLLPYFKDARRYSESVYSASEKMFRIIMKTIARKEGYSADDLTCLTQKEFEAYIQKRKLPPPTILKQRFAKSALLSVRGKTDIMLGRSVDRITSSIHAQTHAETKKIHGISAYPGTVTGRARIVLNPFRVKAFGKGDILITGMTRPEFLPLIRKASAIVTDVGGVLCHAAITAREFRIPCVVGTGVATKVFKNNQRLRVRAATGVIERI